MRCICLCLFFFSSRRRHTRCLSDWSSDVCSSDLSGLGYAVSRQEFETAGVKVRNLEVRRAGAGKTQIGRASCRERGEVAGVAGSVKKKMSTRRDGVAGHSNGDG